MMTKSQFLVQNYSKLYQNSQKSYILGLKWVKLSILPQLYHYYSPPLPACLKNITAAQLVTCSNTQEASEL